MKPYSLLFPAAFIAFLGAFWVDSQPHAPPAVSPETMTVFNAVYRPKVGVGGNLKLAYLCPETGTTCRLIFSWVKPGNFNAATDSARVTWLQVTPAPSVNIRNGIRPDANSADTINITRPDSGTKTGTVSCVITGRDGLVRQCNAPLSWSIELPVAPVDTASSLKLMGILVKPDSAAITAQMWVDLGIYMDAGVKDTLYDKNGAKLPFTCPAAGPKCPSQQFCGYARMGDFTIAMVTMTDIIPCCRGIFDKLPNHRATYEPAQVANRDESDIKIHIAMGEDGVVKPTEVKFAGTRLVQTSSGEWIRPDFLPVAVATH